MESPLGARMRINGRDVDYFCGTSYFCLHGHPKVIEAACAATRRYGMGPGTLAHVEVYSELQEKLRNWFNVEQVVSLISGYSSPMAMLQGLRDDFDIVIIDAAIHYSGKDATPTLGKPVHSFRHLDPDHLSEVLAGEVKPGQRPVVVTDGVFPSSGALAPLQEYRRHLDKYHGSLLAIDDSHGMGAIGSTGRGSLQYFGLENDGNFLAGTLSKAFGALGGIIPGDEALSKKIMANAMIMRGASPIPPGSAAAAIAAMEVLENNPGMRERLVENVAHMRCGLRKLGFAVAENPVPIVTVQGDVDFHKLRAQLEQRDIIVKVTKAFGYSDAPDVPTLRLAVFSEHTSEQINRLLSSIAEFL
ncbi:aminotransferase class I/II-fold pyridoxal phosphate-dependent enzyme [Candidatus Phyllobacterium onerii]|uniref:aminotransferase class I/II-fold pyridoxal phosphate-dependent enzyme n=1 Tax=Candidatus Phyllobacterium onerii TaxID=3020828 RepID=UPI00233051D1|nr:pyridoxal phosphate-dependent aminotransferase family protein [Phyllobacterium sp. IY22]